MTAAASAPARFAPMLASVASEIPSGDAWVFEPKYDGIRILAFVDRKAVALVSRNGLDKTRSFPEIADAMEGLFKRRKKPFLLDGEIVALASGGPARFQELQGRMHVIDAGSIVERRESTPTAFIAFDLLLDGDVTLVAEPWRARRKRLAALLKGAENDTLRLSDVGEDGEAMLREARTRGWEGVIAKRADAPYRPAQRSRDWLKLKIEKRQEFVVGGWTEPRKSREHIGALLLGYYDKNGGLVYAGHTGTGFTRAGLREMGAKLTRIERKNSPFTTTPRTNEPAHWVTPSIVVEVKFNEWTTDGKLRQPVYLGMRDDKSPTEVVQEPASLPTPAPKKTSRRKAVDKRDPEAVAARLDEIEREEDGSGTLDLPTGLLEVSNLDKVFFPETKQTKGDLMRYYARMSPMLLPTLEDRPLVMKRFPNGIRGKAFYQQKAPADAPPSVRVEAVADEGLTPANRLVGGDLATLLYLVQLGAISVDPWHSRTKSVQFADYAIVDLDPGPRASFARVVDVAHAVKDVLDQFGLRAVPKTSGASGMHIVLPLPPGVPNDGARIVAELIATLSVERRRKVATIERSVSARPASSVYVDFLQNIRGKTVAGVYSVRAEPRATVSTPLTWDEVDEDLDPAAFTMDAVLERVRARGDLWAKGMSKPNSLDGVMRHA